MSILTDNERSYLFDSMTNLLEEYDYNYNDDSIYAIIDRWAEQKSDLITAFKKHPKYLDGQFCIAFASDYERTVDYKTVNDFVDWILTKVAYNYKAILPQEILDKTVRWAFCPGFVETIFTGLRGDWADRTVCEAMATFVNSNMPNIHAHTGEKTSRLINRICVYLNYAKHPDYNREFAKFADALSPIVVKRHTILSLNPLDYLTMSFGNSWASCHTIDKDNKRHMPNSYEGMYSSGTMSYMLDPSSMVFYTVDASYDGNEYWNEPKINRQMYHYQHDKLIQSRLYPQDNDGHSETYSPYRAIVQEIISTVFDFPNLWTLKKGTNHISSVTCSCGTHYRDYYNFNNCTLSIRKESTDEHHVNIGAKPICIECGSEHMREDNINCCDESDGYHCERCGCYIGEDDVNWVGDFPYCCDCSSYCEDCDEYYSVEDEVYIDREDRYVCRWCADEHYTRCDHCDEYCHNDDIFHVESTGEDVCPDCLKRYYTECAKCGKYHLKNKVTKLNGKFYCKDCAEEMTEEDAE